MFKKGDIVKVIEEPDGTTYLSAINNIGVVNQVFNDGDIEVCLPFHYNTCTYIFSENQLLVPTNKEIEKKFTEMIMSKR